MKPFGRNREMPNMAFEWVPTAARHPILRWHLGSSVACVKYWKQIGVNVLTDRLSRGL